MDCNSLRLSNSQADLHSLLRILIFSTLVWCSSFCFIMTLDATLPVAFALVTQYYGYEYWLWTNVHSQRFKSAGGSKVNLLTEIKKGLMRRDMTAVLVIYQLNHKQLLEDPERISKTASTRKLISNHRLPSWNIGPSIVRPFSENNSIQSYCFPIFLSFIHVY